MDMQLNGWQTFNEAPRQKLLDIMILLEGYQNNASDSWYVQFFDYNIGNWDTSWYSLGSLPTTPDGNLQVYVGDASRVQRFVSATGAFRLRFADDDTVNGGNDAVRTRLYIDFLQAIFIYDITSPISSVTAPLDMEYTNAHVYTVRGISSDPGQDPSGVSLVEVSTDGGTIWNPAVPSAPGDYDSWTFPWTVPAEGTYTIRSRATDRVNNVETPSAGTRLVVDWTYPQVGSVFPSGGSTNIPVDTVITATFLENNDMSANTINTSTFTLVDEEGSLVPGTVTYDAVTKTASFRPNNYLFYGYTYTAVLTTGITDLAGNPLPSSYSWSFRTSDILSLTLVDTFNRDGTPGGGSVGFGSLSPEGSPFVIGGGNPPYAVRLNVLCSTNWNLYLHATGDLVDSSQSPPAVIPIGQLQWKLTGNNPWNPFNLSEQQVFYPPRNRTPQPGGSEVYFDLSLTLNWEDSPGDYSSTLVFLVMTQP